MKDQDKIKEELIIELDELRQKNLKLETSTTQLKQIVTLLRNIVELVPDSIVTVNSDGVITSCNTATTRMLGFSRDKLIGKHFKKVNIFKNKDIQKYLKLFNSILCGEVTEPFELEFYRKDGTSFWAEVHVSILKKDGKVLELQAILKDISKHKQGEKTLRENMEKYQNLFENAQVGMYRSLLDGSAYLAVNKKLTEIFGYSKEEMLLEPVTFRWAYPEERDKMVRQIQKKGCLTDYEITILTKSGEKKNILTSIKLYPEQGYIEGTVLDITDRKQAMEALRFLSLITEQVTDSIIVTNLDFEIVYINKETERLYGYSKLELIGRTPQILNAEMESKKIQEDILKFISSDKMWTGELLNKRKDGSTFNCELKISQLIDEQGKTFSYIIIQRDITERKQAEKIQAVLFQISQATTMSNNLEELLKIIHQQLGLLIDTTNFYVALYDKDTDLYSFPFYVDEFDKLEDYSSMKLEKSLTDYVRRAGEPLLVNETLYQKLIKKGEIKLVGTRSPIWLGVPLKTARGVIGVVTVQSYKEESLYSEKDLELLSFVSDNIALAIERKRAEEAFAAEKERLAVTLRSIGDGVISTDIEGRIVLMNKVAEELTGWNESDAVGKPIAEVFQIYNESSRKHCVNPVDKVIKSGMIIELSNHTMLISKDGTERIIADSGAPIRDKNSIIIGVVLVFRDVTEQRKMEEELIKATKLESIGMLAGGIAHDFNNILTAITGNVSLAKTRTDPEDEMFEMLTDVENASKRARDLTLQLLTFSKGGAPIKKTTSIANLIVNSVNFALRGSNVRCGFSIPDNTWTVEVDEGQMIQVINNLIINADQAMPDGGLIQVQLENTKLAKDQIPCLNEGNYIKFSVTDNGIGIPDKFIHKIFDPYFTTKEKGSGLGLATSYSIVKKHDGHIIVESVIGTGTTFYVYLPASLKEIQTKKNAKKTVYHGEGKILIMDDEEVVRKIAGQMVKYLGYEACFTEDGTEAIELYKQALNSKDPFDVVLMDLTIPGGMGGKETVEKLLNIDPNVRTIVSSGYSNDPIMADFNEYGFSGFISKPYNIKELSNILRIIINKNNSQV